MMAVTYGNVYVARVAIGANDTPDPQGLQGSRGLRRAVAHHRLQPLHRPRLRPGPRPRSAEGGRATPATGRCSATTRRWPARARIPSSSIPVRPRIPLKEYIYNETRYTMLVKSNPEEAKRLLALAEEDVKNRWKLYEYMSADARRTARMEASNDRPVQNHRPDDPATSGLKLKNPLVASSSPVHARRSPTSGAWRTPASPPWSCPRSSRSRSPWRARSSTAPSPPPRT